MDHSPSRTLSPPASEGFGNWMSLGSLPSESGDRNDHASEKLWDGQWAGGGLPQEGPVSQESAVPGAGTGVSPETAGCNRATTCPPKASGE